MNEELKRALTWIFTVSQDVDNALLDGKINVFEAIRIGGRAFGLVDVIQARHRLVAEIAKLDTFGRAELETWAKNQFKFSANLKLEETILKAIALIVHVLDFSADMAAVWKTK